MSIDEIATYRLAAGMLEDMIEYVDSEHAKLNAKHAPLNEAE